MAIESSEGALAVEASRDKIGRNADTQLRQTQNAESKDAARDHEAVERSAPPELLKSRINLIMAALMLTVCVVCLDNFILAPALPVIAV